MTTRLKIRLWTFFEGLPADLEIGLASALAHKCNCSTAEVFAAYEAWQIAGFQSESALSN
jgi:hypothetical protein